MEKRDCKHVPNTSRTPPLEPHRESRWFYRLFYMSNHSSGFDRLGDIPFPFRRASHREGLWHRQAPFMGMSELAGTRGRCMNLPSCRRMNPQTPRRKRLRLTPSARGPDASKRTAPSAGLGTDVHPDKASGQGSRPDARCRCRRQSVSRPHSADIDGGHLCRCLQPSDSAQTPRHQRRIAFCACRRFSASSKITEFGPSMMLDVTSSPLWAGRQCMNNVSALAPAISVSST